MTLPAELLAPPPRDPHHAQRFLAKTRKTARQLLTGGALLVPLLTVIFGLAGGFDGKAFGVAAVVGGLVIFMGVALLANTQRSLALFREGTATLGRIHKVNAPADQHGNATVILEVTFTGAQGPCTGQVVMLGKLGEFDAREGLEVPVLFSAAKPKQFAVYASGLGMYVGTVK